MNTIVEEKFDCYCKKVLRNEFLDISKKRNKYAQREISLEVLKNKQLNQLFYAPVYEIENTTFVVYDCDCLITDENLEKSLIKLSSIDLEIILLYYFMDMTDREIAQLLNHNRKTINRKRNKSLEKLKEYILGLNDE